jgi:hypothetical protein
MGVSLALSICCALVLVDDHVDAYVFVSVFVLLGTVVGIGLRDRCSWLMSPGGAVGAAIRGAVFGANVALGLVSGVILGSSGVAGVGWLLGLVSGFAFGGLLWAPTVLSGRAGRLLVPVAWGVAVSVAVAAFTFYVRRSPYEFGSEPTAFVRLPQGQSGSPVRFIVEYLFHGCSDPVQVEFLYLGSQLPSPQAVISTVPSPLTGAPAGHVLTPGLLPGDAGPLMDKEVQVRPRGFIGSCYLDLAQFVGPWAGVKAADRLAHQELIGVSAAPLSEGANLLFLHGASLSVLSGESPTRAGEPSSWACHASAEVSSPQKLCSAILVLTESWYQTWQNLMLVVIGALLATVVALAGRAIGGFGWFAVEPAPGDAD